MAEDVLELVANTSDGVFAVRSDHRIILWNKGAEALLGFRAREVLGRYCYEVLGGIDQSRHPICYKGCQALVAAGRGKLVPTRNLATRTKIGQEIWVNMTSIVIPSKRNDLAILVHIFRDFTRQKEVERFVHRLLSSVAKPSWCEGFEALPNPPPSHDPPEDLTSREVQVLQLLALGTPTKAIAQRLCISPSTVKNHIQNIFSKLKVHSRVQAVALAFRYNLIQGTDFVT